jgi:K+/H+ antiporter YhaU regulatory subunit KhtT
MLVNPDPHTVLPLGARMVLIGSAEAQKQFIRHYVNR